MSTTAAKFQDWVIDRDTHITEPGDLSTSRWPARYKTLAPHIEHKVLFENAAKLHKVAPPDVTPSVPIG